MPKQSLLTLLKKTIKDPQYKIEIDPYCLLSLQDTETFSKIDESGIVTLDGDNLYFCLEKRGGLTIAEEQELEDEKSDLQFKFIDYIVRIFNRIEDEKSAIQKDDSLSPEQKEKIIKEKNDLKAKVKNSLDDQDIWQYLTEQEL